MARGGRRAGNRGQAYGQRTDLHSPLPLSAPTGLPYGSRGELIQAQRAVPMAPAPGPAATSPAGPPTPPPTPGQFPLMRPTERPNEPVTAGLPSGPGPGPEALGPLGQQAMVNQGQNVGALLQSLAASPLATPQVKQLAAYAQGGGK